MYRAKVYGKYDHPYMEDNEATYGSFIYAIWQTGTAVYLRTNDPSTYELREEQIDPLDITLIYNAVKRGEGENFEQFINDHIDLPF